MKKSIQLLCLLSFFAINSISCKIILESPAFRYGEFIPKKYTCEGENISPALQWKNVPDGNKTKSIAIICDDPNAPTKEPFVHWIIFNIKSNAFGLPENVANKEFFTIQCVLEQLRGARQGRNGFGKIGYNGPCPPKKHGVHNYNFTIYALDKMLDLPAGSTKKDLLQAMKGHIISTAKLIGKFERK